ncbi:hypothetical protein [Micromonospora rubida]|uniref:hypothetical protein n=1 Tax=Micromonospora rubida TaxID=2697657 RepID=UPI0013777F83|nr:hypothetical protein [Micromonospora rubida]NBE79580.1 hypothetical protein [Micromonospora rubida]
MPRNYTKSTIKLLFGTATHCAYPGCAAKLIFQDRGLYTAVTEVAHIRSEQVNGPRYDPTYPVVKLDEFDNLLLLCGQHHPPVDRHESAYTVEELLEWKKAQAEQGDRPLREAELAAIERQVNKAQPIASSAILRGPVHDLGEAERLQQAQDRLSEAPQEAAELFGQVASALEASPFVQHASIVRGRQAGALEAAQNFEAAGELRIDLGWRSYRSGDRFDIQQQLREISKYESSLKEETRRGAAGLSVIAGFGFDRSISIENLAEVFDEMEPSDPGYANCGLALAEQAIVWRRSDLITARTESISNLLNDASLDAAGLRFRARIAMCLAEASDDWISLLGVARTVYPPELVAWIAARHARYLSLVGRPDDAIQRWLDAIDKAVAENLNDSAASWLYGQRLTKLQYRRLEANLDELHRLAQALRAAGSDSVLPEAYPLAERALSRMLDKKWPDAFEYLHQYLSHSVITASWQGEQTAHGRFGDLFAATEQWDEAIKHYVWAGRYSTLEKLVPSLPDHPLQFEPPPKDAPVWERIASFNFVAKMPDILPAELAKTWSSACMEELVGVDQDKSWTDFRIAAFDAFAAVSDEASKSDAENFLNLAQGLFRREPGSHYRTDEGHVKAVVKLAGAYPELRERVAGMLCEAILIDNEVAQNAISSGETILRDYPKIVEATLARAASEGHVHAALAMVVLGADPTPALQVARNEVARDLQPVERAPGMMTLGTLVRRTGILATILPESDQIRFAEAMLARLRDVEDEANNRGDALAAISRVAQQLSTDEKAKIFDVLIEFAQNPTDSEPPVRFGFGDDPFSRFKFNIPVPPLAAAALHSSALLASNPEQYRRVRELTLELMPGADDRSMRILAQALLSVSSTEIEDSVPFFAAHPSRWLRCLAAVLWSKNPRRWPQLGERLARDAEPRVRFTLAAEMGSEADFDSTRQILQQDPRRGIKRAAQRR